MFARLTTRPLRSALTAAVLTAGIAASVTVPVQAASLCGALTTVTLSDGTQLCTHGADDHLGAVLDTVTDTVDAVVDHSHAPGTAAHVHTGLLPAAGATVSLGSVEASVSVGSPDPKVAEAESTSSSDRAVPSIAPKCVTDGRDGARLEALAVDVEGAVATPAAVADIRRWVGQADWTFATSAEQDGATRRLRLVTDAVGDRCELRVTRVRLSASEAADYASTWRALADRGHNRSDRKYLVFVNADQGICGIGTVRPDDQPGPENASNRMVGYAQVNAPCWTAADQGHYSVLAHEIAHNLGAVQASAPHTTNGYHCTDNWDIMCYDDSGTQSMTVRCTDQDESTVGEADANNRLLDCGGDDYFNASPNVSGYLAAHWNVADSVFLAGRPTPAAQPEPATSDESADEPSGEKEEASSSSPILDLTGENSPTATILNWVVSVLALLAGLA